MSRVPECPGIFRSMWAYLRWANTRPLRSSPPKFCRHGDWSGVHFDRLVCTRCGKRRRRTLTERLGR